jgi:hypothetical protein
MQLGSYAFHEKRCNARHTSLKCVNNFLLYFPHSMTDLEIWIKFGMRYAYNAAEDLWGL